MGALNLMPQYRDYFQLNNSLRSLNIAINYIGGSLAVGIPYGLSFPLPTVACELIAGIRADS